MLHKFGLAAVSGGYSLAGVCRLLIVVASLVREHGLQASHCGGFSCYGAQASVIVAHRLSCPTACGIFPVRGLNPGPLHWQEDS